MTHEIIQELSYDTVIPSVMLINEQLELTAVKLYAFIKGLTRAHGYCFATNQYLASLMKADVSSVKRWLAMLKKEGYIEIETQKSGVHWQRKIYISDKFKKCLRRLTDELPPAYACAPPSLPVSHITKDYIKEDYKKEREEAAPPPPTTFSEKRVTMDRNKYESLVEEYGLEKIKKFIDRLDEYADINPKRFKQYACHAAVIRKWIREDHEKPVSKKSDNAKFAEDLCRKINHPLVHFVQGKGITIETGGQGAPIEISFMESGFKDQIFSQFRKRNIPIPAGFS